jgi:hypothetical protein
LALFVEFAEQLGKLAEQLGKLDEPRRRQARALHAKTWQRDSAASRCPMRCPK